MELIRKRCEYCKGVGLIVLKEKKVCKNCNGKVCYKCEKWGGHKTMEECEKCCGNGEIYFDTKTMEQKFLFTLKKYSFKE